MRRSCPYLRSALRSRYPYLRAVFPGIAVIVRNAEHERQVIRNDMICVGLYTGILLLCAAWMVWQVFA